MDRRAVERWSTWLGAAVLAGFFYFYVLVWLDPHGTNGDLERWLRQITDGVADAPYQYRILVPGLSVGIADHSAATVTQATKFVDGLALAVMSVFGFTLLRRAGLAAYSAVAALYVAFVGFGVLTLGKPETMVAAAALTGISVVLASQPDDAWSRSGGHWIAIGVGALVLAGCRTDLLLALGAGFLASWWQTRLRTCVVAGVGLVALGAIATLALVARYPDAQYPPGVHLVRLADNLDAVPIFVALVILAPVLMPIYIAHRYDIAAGRAVVAQRLPLLVMVAVEVVFTLVFGVIQEVRILFPFAFVLALIGLEGWVAIATSTVDRVAHVDDH